MDAPIVLVFVMPGCPHSARVKAHLAARGVAYVERDVTADRAALHDMLCYGGRAVVPTTVIGTHVLVGFDADWIDRQLHPEPATGPEGRKKDADDRPSQDDDRPKGEGK